MHHHTAIKLTHLYNKATCKSQKKVRKISFSKLASQTCKEVLEAAKTVFPPKFMWTPALQVLRTVSSFSSSTWLTGGEKSYTTVAFALALGEWTQSPFRAMDEFDVFMDAINRRVAMENLFSNSLEHPDLQFIFLTPQVSLPAGMSIVMPLIHCCILM